jgi:hypothetical protein
MTLWRRLRESRVNLPRNARKLILFRPEAPNRPAARLGSGQCYVISTHMIFSNPLALSSGIVARLGLSALVACLLWAGVAWALSA